MARLWQWECVQVFVCFSHFVCSFARAAHPLNVFHSYTYTSVSGRIFWLFNLEYYFHHSHYSHYYTNKMPLCVWAWNNASSEWKKKSQTFIWINFYRVFVRALRNNSNKSPTTAEKCVYFSIWKCCSLVCVLDLVFFCLSVQADAAIFANGRNGPAVVLVCVTMMSELHE